MSIKAIATYLMYAALPVLVPVAVLTAWIWVPLMLAWFDVTESTKEVP